MTGQPNRLWWPVLAIVGLLGAAMLAAAFGNPAIDVLPVELRPVSSGPPRIEDTAPEETNLAPPSDSQAPSAAPGGVVLIAAGVVLVLLAIVVGWWLARGAKSVRFTRVRRPVRILPPDDAGRLRAAIDEGLNELDETDADPRRAVIACWLRLERTAAEAGTPREPGDTSTDLVARVLAVHRVSSEVLAGLAALYREARFASHAVNPDMRDQARTALRRVRDELVAGAGVGA